MQRKIFLRNLNISQYDIIISIIAAASLFLLLAGFVIAFVLKYQKRRQQHSREMATLKNTFEKQLLQSQIEVQEATFAALGKELHDNIGQLLSSTKMLLGVTHRNLTNTPDTLTTAEETLGKAINELRSLSKSLTKEWLEQFDLIENLQAEVTRINSANEVHIFLSSPQNLSLQTDKQIILFRIIQEALQNAVKHAKPKNIAISIAEDSAAITATIKDDGKGFDETEEQKGIGLMNMKHRTQLLNGSINWQSNKKDGTLVNIILPVTKLPDEN